MEENGANCSNRALEWWRWGRRSSAHAKGRTTLEESGVVLYGGKKLE
jgi:hypothetical protein